ncbi:MAG: DNA primase [Candidatus Coatesbacteria bacterium]|nr:DNA primase [Candidatus Coatesbacteria bacterium]
MFNRDLIEDIKERTSIVEVIANYVRLTASGKNYKALCPFHTEKTPSFVVSEEKGLWHCFGCNKGGNVFDFLMEIEHINFPEAVNVLANRLGIKITRTDKFEDNNWIYEINNEASDYFRRQLLENHKVLDYLIKTRKLEPKWIDTFQLGFASSGWRNLLDLLQRKKISMDNILKSGLVSIKDNQVFDRFRQQIIFPITNRDGQVIAFAGRRYETEEGAKYFNSSDSKWFQKGNILYGWYQAKKTISEKRSLFITEGYFDVIKMHQTSFRNTVAPMGTGLTRNQVRITSGYSDETILLFDGDSAGLKATLRAINLFLENGISPKVVPMPENEDPDSLADRDLDELKGCISNRINWLHFLMKLSENAYSKADPDKKTKIINRFRKVISLLPDPIAQEIYWNEIKENYGINRDWIQEKSIVTKASYREEDKKESLEMIYEEFLLMFCKNPDWQMIVNTIPSDRILSPLYRRLYDFLILQHFGEGGISFNELNPEEKSTITKIIVKERDLQDTISIWSISVKIVYLFLMNEIETLRKEKMTSELASRMRILQKALQIIRPMRFKVDIDKVEELKSTIDKINLLINN